MIKHKKKLFGRYVVTKVNLTVLNIYYKSESNNESLQSKIRF